MQEILRLRFLERDKGFTEKLTSIKNEMAARGLFNSGATVKAGHDALVSELVGSRKTIVATISEDLKVTKPHKIDKILIENAIEWLGNRKVFLEQFYLEQMKPLISNLKNRKMLEPYLNLSDVIELNEHELQVELSQEIESYISSRGATLYDRIKNQFLDRPLIVIGVIVFATVSAILTFIGLLSAF